MNETLKCWLRISQLPGLNCQTLNRLYEHFGSAEAIVGASLSELQSFGLKRPVIDRLRLVGRTRDAGIAEERVAAWLEAPDNHLISLADSRYPPALRAIPDPPPLLYVSGDPELLAQPQVALVGSRHASVSGLEAARDFAKGLSRAGFVITSGLALGIDGQAHRGALEGLGLTVGVMGCGCDRRYPARHRDLAEAIITAGGALVSEQPLETPPRAGNFPRRNRIISGLSLGVLVVEAAPRSGSLITARLAIEQGREVFAMPGSIHNPAARGCHELIRQGAKLVETLDHVLEELAPQLPPMTAAASRERIRPEPAVGIAAKLLDFTGYEPTPVDSLVMRSGIAADQVLSAMLELELEGWVMSVPGGFQRT